MILVVVMTVLITGTAHAMIILILTRIETAIFKNMIFSILPNGEGYARSFFLAPTGAQGSLCVSVYLSVRHKFVCSSEFSSFFHRSVSGKSQVSLR